MYISIAAVQRKYESVRRQWKIDEDDGKKELLKAMGKKKKYRARRKRASSPLSLWLCYWCLSNICSSEVRYTFNGCAGKWEGEMETTLCWFYVWRIWWYGRPADYHIASFAVEIKTFVTRSFQYTVTLVTTVIFYRFNRLFIPAGWALPTKNHKRRLCNG